MVLPRGNSLNKFNKKIYLFGLLFILLALTIFIWDYGTLISLGFDDFSYHLAVAQAFVRANGVVTWDFWESLPIGRPHNYPPLMHVVLSLFLQLGFSTAQSAKLILEFVLVGGFAFFAFGLTKVFNIKIAFWSVFLLILWSSFLRMSATVLPSTLVIFCAPAILYFSLNKKWLSLWSILVLIFYTHLFLPYFMLLALLLYLLMFERKILFKTFLVILLAFLLYSPWIIHVLFSGLDYIKYFDSSSTYKVISSSLRINFFIIALAIFGFIWIILNRKINFLRPGYFFVIFLIILLPINLVSINRSFNGHLLIIMAVISSLALPALFKKKIIKGLAAVFFISYLWKTPYLTIDHGNLADVKLSPTFLNVLFSSYFKDQQFAEEKYRNAFKTIEQNSNRGDSIAGAVWEFEGGNYVQIAQITPALFFGANSGRPVLNLRQPELHHRDDPDFKKARIVILSVPKEDLNVSYLINVGLKTRNADILGNHFSLVSNKQWSEANKIYIYKNNLIDTIKETLPSFRFPLWLADLLLIILIGTMIGNQFKKYLPEKQPSASKDILY